MNCSAEVAAEVYAKADIIAAKQDTLAVSLTNAAEWHTKKKQKYKGFSFLWLLRSWSYISIAG